MKQLTSNSYDAVIYLTENSKRVFVKRKYIEALRIIKAKKFWMINFNFELFNYFHSRIFNTAFFKLFFDWEIKVYFYKEEPLYLIRDMGFFIRGFGQRVLLMLKKRDADFDLNASKEAFEFRKFHIEDNNTNDLIEMPKEQLEYEIKRVHTKE